MILLDVGRSISATQAPITSCYSLENRDHLVLSEERRSIGGSNKAGLVVLGTTCYSGSLGYAETALVALMGIMK